MGVSLMPPLPDPIAEAMTIVGHSLAALLARIDALEARAIAQDDRIASVEMLAGIRILGMAKPHP